MMRLFNGIRVRILRWLVDYYLPKPWRGVDTSSAVTTERLECDHFSLKLYCPRQVRPDRAICYFHGGGFVLGSLKGSNQQYEDMATRLGVLLIAVDYRLAPEHPFPAAAEDAIASVERCFHEIQRFGINKLYVAGDSAGGNLAAVTALHYGQRLAGQILLYPVIGYYEPATPSYRLFATAQGLTRKMMIWFWDNYLGDNAAANMQNPLVFPLYAGDEVLKQAPATLIYTAGLDVLRDEGDAYSSRLVSLGVSVEYCCFSEAQHGFFGAMGPVGDYLRASTDIRAWMNAH